MSKFGSAAIVYTDPGTGTERVLLLDAPLRELRPGFSQTTFWAESLDKTATSAITVGSGAYELVGVVRYENNPQGLLDAVRYGATNTTLTYIPDLADPDQSYSVKLIAPVSVEQLTMNLDRQRAVNGEMEAELRFRQTDQTAFPEVLAGTPVLFKYVAGGSLSDGTFSRADTATYASKGYGTVTSAATGKARIHWMDLNADGVRETPTLLLEGTSTNLITSSENFGAWSVSNTPVLTSGQSDPAGGTSAYLIADDNAAAAEYVFLAPTFTTDAVSKACSVFLKQGTSVAAGGSQFQLLDATAGTARVDMQITWSSGVPTVTVTTGTHLGTVRYRDGWYRFLFRSTAVTVANTHRFSIIPARTVAQTGNIYAYGAQAENALNPSSYIPTSGGTDARTRDAVTFPFPAKVQTLTIYHRYVQQGTLPWSATINSYVISLGQTSTTESLVSIENTLNAATMSMSIAGAGSGTSGAVANAATSGQVVEVRGLLRYTAATRTATVQLGVSIAGGTETLGTVSAAIAMADGFASDTVCLNGLGGGTANDAFTLTTHTLVMRGVQSVETMRRVAGV